MVPPVDDSVANLVVAFAASIGDRALARGASVRAHDAIARHALIAIASAATAAEVWIECLDFQ